MSSNASKFVKKEATALNFRVIPKGKRKPRLHTMHGRDELECIEKLKEAIEKIGGRVVDGYFCPSEEVSPGFYCDFIIQRGFSLGEEQLKKINGGQ